MTGLRFCFLNISGTSSGSLGAVYNLAKEHHCTRRHWNQAGPKLYHSNKKMELLVLEASCESPTCWQWLCSEHQVPGLCLACFSGKFLQFFFLHVLFFMLRPTLEPPPWRVGRKSPPSQRCLAFFSWLFKKKKSFWVAFF